MAFGQQSGPAASAAQVRELLALLKDAGHSDFRDARGPMGFTQRQAAGKFSRDEAAAFIGKLLDAESGGSIAVAAPAWRQSAQEQMMSSLPSEQLADQLRRRGWTVIEPKSRRSGAGSGPWNGDAPMR
jgi:anti-anti-sigma factor